MAENDAIDAVRSSPHPTEKLTDPKDDSRKYEELRLLYSISVADIAAFKQQQWNITNYALLLYAAVISVAKLVDDLSRLEVAVLYFAAFAVMINGWYLISIYHASIMERRARLVEIRTNFTVDFMAAWRGGQSADEVPDRLDRIDKKTSLLWFFQSVIGAGFLMVSWLLFRIAVPAQT